MGTHPYLRAYMAGIVVPTVGTLAMLSVFVTFRLILDLPVPIERAIVFPMALVPNLWGVWNMLYVRVRRLGRWKIGIHGVLLPGIMVPFGYLIGRALGILQTTPQGLVYFGVIALDYAHIAIAIGFALAIYYLIWKYVVNFFNEVLGIA